MTKVLVRFDEAINSAAGQSYFVQAMGKRRDDGLWEGWLEFLRVNSDDEPLSSGRETTQPNRRDLDYWAQGLTRVYLQGALDRAERASASVRPNEFAPKVTR